ncbi:FISUMP domain-containing protein [Fibrobacter sp.]
MKIFKKLLVAGGAASIAFTACSIVDEYDQELVDRYEQAVQDEKDSVKQAEQDRKDSIANLDSATCPETFTDTRDENVYDIVRIYDPEVDSKARCWFKQNLKYDAKDDSRCLDDDKKNCKVYGRLYLGSAIKKGVCPEGTRVSTSEDWEHLLKVVDPDENSSYILKNAEEWIAGGSASKATDKYGFSAMPGGFYDDDEEEYTEEFHNDGHWWVYSKDSFKYVRMSADDNLYEFRTIDAYNSEGIGLSVRCVLESNHSIEADTSSSEGDKSSSSEGDGEVKSSSSEGSSDTESSSSEEVDPEDVIVPQNDVSIDGVSQKGPFIKGTTVSVYELDNGRNLSPKGTAFPTEITTDDGKFKLSNLKLKSQFVYLVAEGYYRNEVTGKGSVAPITLRAVSDLTKMKTINVNLLTHLEFFRAEYLVVNKGMRVSKAKIQADKEIFKNFFIDATEFKAAEKLSVVGSSDEDAALLALSVIFQGDFTEAQLTDVINTFKDEIKDQEKGEWKNDSLKTVLADWVANAEFKDHFKSIRDNVEGWGLGKPGNFEKYLTNFWLTMYGMDPCTSASEGKITSTENKYSKNKKESKARFVCKSGNWELATDLEKDTEGWTSGKDGQVKNGKVNTDSVYVFDGTMWRKGNVLDSTLGIGACYTKSNRDLKKSATDGEWYICDMDSAKWVNTHNLNSYFAKFTPDDKLSFFNTAITDVVNDTMIDPRDGHVYRTFKNEYENYLTGETETLIWMAENLNYDPKSTDVQSWCYGDLDYNCEIAGRLYSWSAVMMVESSYNTTTYSETENHQGICPEGWVVPTEDDVANLVMELISESGEELKTTFTGAWTKGSSNTYGFSAIPSGYRKAANNTFVGAGSEFRMWTTTNDFSDANIQPIRDAGSLLPEDASKLDGASVRCVKRVEP